ncbi:MAG: hypothetical protein ACREP9_01760 [Candidatus Dormibacteraceae bacterium]
MKKDHLEVLLEDIDDKMQRLAEGVSLIQDDMRVVKKDVSEIPEMKDDIKAIKAAVTDHSGELRDHKVRITALEQAA